jgi:hypothetical protein
VAKTTTFDFIQDDAPSGHNKVCGTPHLEGCPIPPRVASTLWSIYTSIITLRFTNKVHNSPCSLCQVNAHEWEHFQNVRLGLATTLYLAPLFVHGETFSLQFFTFGVTF